VLQCPARVVLPTAVARGRLEILGQQSQGTVRCAFGQVPKSLLVVSWLAIRNLLVLLLNTCRDQAWLRVNVIHTPKLSSQSAS
jgi:hypothetical protein